MRIRIGANEGEYGENKAKLLYFMLIAKVSLIATYSTHWKVTS